MNEELAQAFLPYGQFLRQEGTFAIVSFGSFLIHQIITSQLHKDKKEYKNLKQSPVRSIQETENDIRLGKKNIVDNASPYGDTQIMFTGFIEGVIQPHPDYQSLPSHLFPEHSFVAKAKLLENLTSQSKDLSEIPNNCFETIPLFRLQDLLTNKEINVKNDFDCEKSYALQGFEKIHPFEENFWDKIRGFLGGLGLKGWAIGISEKEVGITVQSYIVIYGQMLYDFKTGRLEMFRPWHFLKEKFQLLEGLKREMKEQERIGLLFLVLGGVSLGIFAVRFFNFYQRKEKKTYRKYNFKIRI